jgi:hypothetical protein
MIGNIKFMEAGLKLPNNIKLFILYLGLGHKIKLKKIF